MLVRSRLASYTLEIILKHMPDTALDDPETKKTVNAAVERCVNDASGQRSEFDPRRMEITTNCDVTTITLPLRFASGVDTDEFRHVLTNCILNVLNGVYVNSVTLEEHPPTSRS